MNVGLKSFTIMRHSDTMLCHVYMDGGNSCAVSSIRVPRQGAGSHLTLADYVAAARAHAKQYHPEVREEDLK